MTCDVQLEVDGPDGALAARIPGSADPMPTVRLLLGQVQAHAERAKRDFSTWVPTVSARQVGSFDPYDALDGEAVAVAARRAGFAGAELA